MAGTAGYKWVNEKEFGKVKGALALGATPSTISKITGRSLGIILRIQKVDSIEEYKKTTTEFNRQHKLVKQKETVVEPQGTKKETNEVAFTLGSILETLIQIQKVLEDINDLNLKVAKASGINTN